MEIRKVRLTLLEEMLGTTPGDPDIYRNFIGSKAPDASTVEDEVAALGADAVVEKGRTVFNKMPDGRPFIYDYHIKGFFKDACSMLSRVSGKDEAGKKKPAVNESGKLRAFKKVIDGLIFIADRQIPIMFDGECGDCSRSLRANTAQGERTSLASSETVPAGSTLEFSIVCLDPDHFKAVEEWLDYGQLRGLGQWRNSGKGRFAWSYVKSRDEDYMPFV